MKKVCSKCKKEKDIHWFDRDNCNPSGYRYRCKICIALEGRIFYKKNREKLIILRKEYREKNREKKNQYQREYYKKDPVRAYAHNKVRQLVFSGKLKRKPCIICGEPKTDAHHQDYTKPLDIMWLCHVHHKEIHGRKYGRKILK